MTRDRALRRLAVRLLAGGCAGALASALLALAVPAVHAATPSAATPAAASSGATTVSGRGEFKEMRFTVSQTRNLSSQAVTVSWTGGTPTTYAGSQFNTDFVQIMQCWGDDDRSVPGNPGPPRTQCQFGASPTTSRGSWPGNGYDDTRSVTYSADPSSYGMDDRYGAGRPFGQGEVPFRAVDGTTITTGTQNNPLFSYNTTNEIDFGHTGADGTGREFFEVQTRNEAPQLGCGTPVRHPDGTVTGRPCWLVIVPQGHLDLDGQPYADRTQVNAGSPVSSTNWRNRIAVRLDFNPVGAACALGAKERDTTGSELVSDAMSSWQSKLCDTGTVYGYTTLGDADARSRLAEKGDSLVFTSRALGTATGTSPPPDKVAYAPVALTGLVIGFTIERQPRSDAPPAVRGTAGTRVDSLDLTPRLVAKLLTESYGNSPWGAVRSTTSGGTSGRVAAKGYAWAAGNPPGLLSDPEFIRYNPEFAHLTVAENPSTDTDLVTALGHTDAARQLWRWLFADRQTRQFLKGQPDEWGMRVNPYFSVDPDLNPTGTAFADDRDDFPKSDPWKTIPPGSSDATVEQSMTDFHPYVDDLHSGALHTRRADQLWKSNWDPLASPPAWKSPGPQTVGRRFMLTVTDAASAARFGLQTARLRNAAGEFTAPARATLLASAAKAVRQDGVLHTDPATKVPGGYPLTLIVQAAARPAGLDAAARRDYAALLRYAAGAGQRPGDAPGDLPRGYAPMPQPLRAEALRTATALADWRPAPSPGSAGPTGPTSGTGPTGPAVGTTVGGSTGGAPGGEAGGGPAADPTGPPTGAPGSGGPGSPSPVPPTAGSAPAAAPVAAGISPADPGGALRYAVPIGAAVGLLAALAAPLAGGARPTAVRLPLRVALPGGRSVTLVPRIPLPTWLRRLRLPGRPGRRPPTA
ncbi:hypothetical protein [Peterkaempfera bronchialis]|uniref:hypothetical protein n=1 Tax=Peterkaempfera bronchialis TaxID=2126346 RepID=UPI003C2E16A8